MASRWRQAVGWLAVVLSALAATFWAFWGTIENFHEGWYYRSLFWNFGLMLAQYLSPMLLVIAGGLVGVRRPRLGGGLHAAGALVVAWFFHGSASVVVYGTIAGPLLFLGALYWLGHPQPRRWAGAVVAGVPLLTLIAAGAAPAVRVASRWDDGDRGARQVAGNGVDLVWAPAGPGWPNEGVSWDEAMRLCRHLTPDGTALAESPQYVWRLPIVEEVVRSQCFHGRTCGGVWDAAATQARYDTTPDKEPPLWDPYSRVIYRWTATEVNEEQAYIAVYNDQVWPRLKRVHWGYLGFRAVREPKSVKGGNQCRPPEVDGN